MKSGVIGFEAQHRAAWLRPAPTDVSFQQRRTQLLLAISDADRMGFDNTKQSLVELLRTLETAHRRN